MSSSYPKVYDGLAAPFPPQQVHFRALTASGGRALAVAYIDARDVMDRLDEVVGFENWKDEYAQISDGCVCCRLSVRVGEWVAKEDVGSPSEQPDKADRVKAAYSDALKRAAIKFGVGRYLYRLPQEWVDYDPVKKKILKPPRLPDWAVPKKAARELGLERGRELFGLCAPSGTDPATVLEHYKVDDFDKLPAEAYQTIKNRLLEKIREAKK